MMASNKLENKLTHLTKLQRGVVVVNRVSPRTNADKNIEVRREAKLIPRVAKKIMLDSILRS